MEHSDKRDEYRFFSSHNVTGFKGYLPRSPSSYPVRVVWNDNEAEIIYMLSTRGAKRGSNYIYFRFQSLSLPLSMITERGQTTVVSIPDPTPLHGEEGLVYFERFLGLDA